MSTPVMWQIRRIRLDHVGPAAARFLDVTLDFTDESGTPLDTILWLRNGGGKSTVLSLVCALIRPHRRDFLATAATGKHLEDYVLGSDTAHVVVEWSGPDGRTLVTGAVYEWADRSQPADPTRDHDRLSSRWYLFAPQEGRAELDLLPFESADGKQTPLREFVAAVRAWDAIPHCGAAVTDGMDRWRAMLDAQGLDPEIFTPILQMNATEGGIEGQFQFRNADQFVEYLLELIVDPEVPGAVAEILERVRAGLAERPGLLADLAFADEAGPRLRELVAAGAADTAAATALEVETGRVRELLAGLAAGADLADAAAAAAQEAVAVHEEDVAGHVAAEDSERQAAQRLRWSAARLRWMAAQESAAEHGRVEQETARRLAAWRAVPAAHAQRAAEQRIRHLEVQLAAATEDAEPLRRRRDAAASDYAAALDAAIAQLDEQVGQAGAEAQAEREAERAARGRAEDAREERARLAAALEAARTALAALDRDLAAAVTAGYLGDGEPVEDALERHRGADAAATADLDDLDAAQKALAGDRQELRERGTAVLTERAVVERERADLDARHRELSARIAELAADERLRALGDGELVDPVAEAGDLGDALAHAIARTQRRRVELAVDGAEDERALATLAAAQLLPGSLDLAHAHDVLEQAGIGAVTGWRHLADAVPPGARAAVLRAAPALASGLLVHDADDLPAAQAALEAAGLRPLSAVLVGTTAQLAAAADEPAAAGFLVPPAPALTDRSAAGAEIAAREQARAGRSEQDAALAAALERDTDLQRRLRDLVAACPPGTLDRLAEQRAVADERLTELARDAADLAEAEDALAVRDGDLHAARAAAEDVRRTAAAATGVLTALADRDLAGHRAAVATLPDALAATARALEDATAAEARHRALAEAAQRHGEALARTQQARRDDRAALGGIAAAATTELPVDAARAAWEAAEHAYRREVAESALASALEEARHAAARARDQVAALPPADVTAAVALVDSPDGSDVDAQSAATARAADAHDAAVAVAADARAEMRAARAELEQLGGTVDGTEQVEARDQETVLAEAAAAEGRAIGHRQDAERARAAAASAAAELTAAHQRASGLRDIAALLSLPGEEGDTDAPAEVAPFTGSLDDARTAVKAAREAWDRAGAEARRARRAVELQGQKLALWASDDRFSSVKPAVRDRFRTDDVTRDLLDDLLPDAERLAGDLELFAAQLRERLGELEEHKGVVVTAMVGMVRQALKALNRAQALSELPDTLGDWAGRRFLEVGPRAAVETADAVLRERCARLVDSLAVRGTPVPRGHELLWQATSAVVGEGNWKAKVLKPSTTFAVERVSVERMRKWSGGEKVTISLLLFTMVAKLRATGRGRDLPGLGALPLDNPLGKANYVVFLDLQRKVAAANGIQLVFLTGVGDLKAVGRFPNVVRLRNARSRTREYVSVAERTVARTDPADAVDATRLWRENPELTLL
ncbi:hypothetical protein ACQEVB_27815 [Pseudonocardia sp. CA-107938]|uniref:hypothetical protein n=1 Tax=Pseudonocardia sp. CA-107938 TaxID=3240021 RepID=UPI003D922A4B